MAKNLRLNKNVKINTKNYFFNKKIALKSALVISLVASIATFGAGLSTGTFLANAESRNLQLGLTTNRTLRVGSNGEDIKNLHRNLNWLGYYTGANSTTYSKDTETSVMKFQKYAGLTQSGVADKATLSKLNLWYNQKVKGNIAVVGDSMSEENRDLIAKNIVNKGYRITDMFTVGGTQMVGNSPYNSIDGKGVIDIYNKDRNNNPDTWLIILGSNDVIWDSGLNTWGSVKNELSQTVSKITQLKDKVYWVNVYVKDMPNSTNHNELTNSKRLNNWLKDQAVLRGNMRVVDWFSRVEANQTMLRDSVHVKSEFRKNYADLATSQL